MKGLSRQRLRCRQAEEPFGRLGMDAGAVLGLQDGSAGSNLIQKQKRETASALFFMEEDNEKISCKSIA